LAGRTSAGNDTSQLLKEYNMPGASNHAAKSVTFTALVPIPVREHFHAIRKRSRRADGSGGISSPEFLDRLLLQATRETVVNAPSLTMDILNADFGHLCAQVSPAAKAHFEGIIGSLGASTSHSVARWLLVQQPSGPASRQADSSRPPPRTLAVDLDCPIDSSQQTVGPENQLPAVTITLQLTADPNHPGQLVVRSAAIAKPALDLSTRPQASPTPPPANGRRVRKANRPRTTAAAMNGCAGSLNGTAALGQ